MRQLPAAWAGGILLLVLGLEVLTGRSPPPSSSAVAPPSAPPQVRLGFIELQAGSRGAPRRVVFASPPSQEVQRPVFELLRGRGLLGMCMDRTSLGAGGLATRHWRKNLTMSLPSAQPAAEAELWQEQRQLAAVREAEEETQTAQSVLLGLRGTDVAGISVVRHDTEVALERVHEGDGPPHVGMGQVVQGQKVVAEMHEAAQRKQKSGPSGCGVTIVESGELLLPEDPEDPSGEQPSLPLLPLLDNDANNERVVLPLGRPIASLHRHQQLTSSEPRDVYHYQVDVSGIQRGQKILLGALSHDAGQPSLLLSYASSGAGFEEAHWALPVECGTEICSYQVRERARVLSLPISLSSDPSYPLLEHPRTLDPTPTQRHLHTHAASQTPPHHPPSHSV